MSWSLSNTSYHLTRHLKSEYVELEEPIFSFEVVWKLKLHLKVESAWTKQNLYTYIKFEFLSCVHSVWKHSYFWRTGKYTFTNISKLP